MKKIDFIIDGKRVSGLPGQTILQVARAHGIDIPTLCYSELTEIYGACGLCVVEIEGRPKMVKACATEITPDIEVKTRTERVLESRKTNLELLLTNHIGDCRGPCTLACPAGTDCQGYVGLIANGQLREAIELIKERIPLPAAIGRVCPHPCEDKCRRALVDEAISIQWLKRYAADIDLFGEDPFLPDIAPETGKRVAIVGGGPMGLSAAYFLRQNGHDITVFEAMPKLGGMLRYGIPEYRLPGAVLDDEIGLIERMGVHLKPNMRLGKDMTFDELKKDYDAVLLGIGAWVSTGMRCKGEELPGVIGGINLLEQVAAGNAPDIGKRVAIVGGGNTAMDACRTAVRLGAEKVYNVYRRTRSEMPADEIEVIEADEEGVIFKHLTNPTEIIPGPDGRASQMVLQIMELGEPDASGRRRPQPVEGKTETLDIDTVILAIGQAVNADGLDGLELTKWGGIKYDAETMMTSAEGVFAGGDCGNDKISIAIEAIADARKAALSIHGYLNGNVQPYREQFVVERDDLDESAFEDRERLCRPDMAHLSPEARKDNFKEFVLGYTEEQALCEADRCLECGCLDYFECQLIEQSNRYGVEPARFAGDQTKAEFEDDHPFLLRDPNKCILCGLCVRVCDEVVGADAIGFVSRGFDTSVLPALGKPLSESGCISCGQCAGVCPTGALMERPLGAKPVPVETERIESICPFCSIGCSVILETSGDRIHKVMPNPEGPANHGLLCGRGKFGYARAEDAERLTLPLMRANGALAETDGASAVSEAARRIEALRGTKGALAVAISDRYTVEEAARIKGFADAIGAEAICFDLRESVVSPSLCTTSGTLDELDHADLILTVGFYAFHHPVADFRMRGAARKGVRVVAIAPTGAPAAEYAEIMRTENSTALLAEAAGILASGADGSLPGLAELCASLDGIKPGEAAKELAEAITAAKRVMFVFQQNVLSDEAAALVSNLALLSGHFGGEGDGILELLPKNNSRGLMELGIRPCTRLPEAVRGLIVFGEDVPALRSRPATLELLIAADTHLTGTAEAADLVFPVVGYGAADGTFVNTEGRRQTVPGRGDAKATAAALADRLCTALGVAPGTAEAIPATPAAPALRPVRNGRLTAPRPLTDHLMNNIGRKLPQHIG